MVILPKVKKAKVPKGLPKRSRNEARKKKYGKYLANCTCLVCHKIFRRPKYRKAHFESFCQVMVGLNKNKV